VMALKIIYGTQQQKEEEEMQFDSALQTDRAENVCDLARDSDVATQSTSRLHLYSKGWRRCYYRNNEQRSVEILSST
jgi:hypothetical protein